MSVPDANDPCGHMPFSTYNWEDISCNFNGYGYHIPWNASVFCLYAAASAVAAQLALQLIGRTILRFKRKNTLYFWSLIVVAVGILIYIMALLFRIFILPVKSPAFSVPYTFAQIFILTGFGLVLYSRLHLITNNTVLLRCLLGMIVVIAFLGHTMSFVQLAIISLNKTLLSRSIMHAISWLDVIFTLQDLILSVAYVYLYWRHMRDSEAFTNERSKRRDATTFRLLIAANSVVLLLDIIQNVLLCLKIYIARYMCFPLICAVRLEVEFFVLNRLVKSAEKSSQSLQIAEFSDVASIAAVKGAEAGVQTRSVVSRHLSDSSTGISSDDSEIKKSNQQRDKQTEPRSNHGQTDYNSMRFLTEAS